ncbi:hypothetical protein [Paenibacillus sp. PK3_47]|uniref:hypothetical protein n=1 Tax=Paenibacillus sp. PK3_47 TaxID=2072642 RepID=UPI00201E26B3|nr:hypothetical protein [Paenibacillus sp. PK3_47]
MKFMRWLAKAACLLMLALLTAGCANEKQNQTRQEVPLQPAVTAMEDVPATTAAEPVSGITREDVPAATPEPCNAIIEWVDFLMINDIKYYQNFEGTLPVSADLLGEQVGEISYMLENNACTDHVTRNGDAAFLPVGTPVYAVKGYRQEFRVAAGSKIYEVNENAKAATMGDLLDIEGKVLKVSLDSGQDGSHIGDFSAEASAQFIGELLPLQNVGFEGVYKKIQSESGVFLRVHLQDGTSLRMVYYPNGNAFTAGAFGTETLKELIMSERSRIKAAAGM